MGKIVKYCSACEESFAEKFAFCPNCAQPMTAFEMNPVSGGGETKLGTNAGQTVIEGGDKAVEDEKLLEIPVAEPISEPIAEPVVAAPTIVQSVPKAETPKTGDTKVFTASNQTQTYNLADLEELESLDEAKAEEPVREEVVPETKTFAAAAAAGANGGDYQTNYRNNAAKEDDGFHITVIEEKNTKQRNGLLLGTMVIMVAIALGSAVVSIFNKDYGIGAIGSNDSLAFVNDVAPVEIEEEEPPKVEKDNGGGGGGGGKNEPDKASQGRLVSQSEKPINPPDAKLPQLTNPDIKIIQETQGKIKRPITEERAGLPGSDNLTASNGTGKGGGLGSGTGTGLGTGSGTGEGSGTGSGSGGGNGNGYGNGTGNSGPGTPPPPPVKPPAGPPTPINIISKPQPRYTDAARTNNVTGTVTLKVTFMANGTIGSVSPVSGLPYGLTEQAIAAAKSIRFDPPKRGGVPYSVSKTITYNFTIY